MLESKKANRIIEIILWVLCIVLLAPMIFIFINSFKTFSDVVMKPLALPKVWNFDNYREVIKKADYVRVFGNTVFFAVFSLVIVIVFGSMAGYKLSRMNNRYSKIFLLVFMLAMMLPFPIIMIPLATIHTAVETDVLIAETVIVGRVPDTYVNYGGPYGSK